MLRLVAITAFVMMAMSQAGAGPDEGAIRHLLEATFDKPESRLIVDPVVVGGGYAIAGWSQGERGGRALLRSRAGNWSLVLCSGDDIKSAQALRQVGVAGDDAKSLSEKLAEAERTLTPERLALLATFDGTMMMDASNLHPQH